jgi:hypothetical protein
MWTSRTSARASHIHRKDSSTLSRLLQSNVHDYCSLYRRTVWETVGGYSPAMYLGAEDWSFWISAAEKGFRSHHLAKPFFLYRNRPGTMVAQVHANQELVKAHSGDASSSICSVRTCRSLRGHDFHTSARRTAEKLARVCAVHPSEWHAATVSATCQDTGGRPELPTKRSSKECRCP